MSVVFGMALQAAIAVDMRMIKNRFKTCPLLFKEGKTALLADALQGLLVR